MNREELCSYRVSITDQWYFIILIVRHCRTTKPVVAVEGGATAVEQQQSVVTPTTTDRNFCPNGIHKLRPQSKLMIEFS